MSNFILDEALRLVLDFDDAQVTQVETALPDINKAIDLCNQAKPLVAEADALYAKAKPLIAEAFAIIAKDGPTLKMVIAALQQKSY
jgi:hypothetical protein